MVPDRIDPGTVPRAESGDRQDRARANLIGLTREQMAARLAAIGTPADRVRMRVDQLWTWIYVRGVRDFAAMTNLARTYRAQLDETCTLEVPDCVRKQVSKDGTRKYLFRLHAGHEVETVYIPEEGRGTVCLSSQVGCTLNCSFCHTGTQAFVRNLMPAEIIGQFMAVRDDLGEWPLPGRHPKSEQRLASNIVLMGMGEPLYNFENVRDAMRIAMDDKGISLSRRRITLSTAGVVPGIARTGAEIGCRLAISLHGTTDEIRSRLVPINRKWGLEELLAALRNYPRLSNADRITFEYAMIRDVNDSDQDARRLVSMLRNIPAKVNLIPFNRWPGTAYQRSTPDRIRSFASIIFRAGYPSPVRTPRGEDILAACGQLKSATQRPRRAARAPERTHITGP